MSAIMVQPCAAIFGGAPANLPVPEIFAYSMPWMRIAKEFYCIVAGRFPDQFYVVSGNRAHLIADRIFVIAPKIQVYRRGFAAARNLPILCCHYFDSVCLQNCITATNCSLNHQQPFYGREKHF